MKGGGGCRPKPQTGNSLSGFLVWGGEGKTTKCTDRNKWMSKNKMSSLSPEKNKEKREEKASKKRFYEKWMGEEHSPANLPPSPPKKK